MVSLTRKEMRLPEDPKSVWESYVNGNGLEYSKHGHIIWGALFELYGGVFNEENYHYFKFFIDTYPQGLGSGAAKKILCGEVHTTYNSAYTTKEMFDLTRLKPACLEYISKIKDPKHRQIILEVYALGAGRKYSSMKVLAEKFGYRYDGSLAALVKGKLDILGKLYPYFIYDTILVYNTGNGLISKYEKDTQGKDVLDRHIQELNLPVKVVLPLTRANIQTIRDLILYTKTGGIRSVRGIGEKGSQLIANELLNRGLLRLADVKWYF